MSIDTRITFLVGAGLVADARVPMSIELAQRLKDGLRETAHRPSTGTRMDAESALARHLLAVFNFLNGGIRFQEGVLDRDPDRPVNIEQVAAAAFELQARLANPVAPYTSGWHQRILELESQCEGLLEKFIDFIYSQLAKWLTISDTDELSYLVRMADLAQNDVGVDIFSLNYDLCIETALLSARRQFVNGFTDDHGWQPSVFEGDHPIRLFKLHGSLDWIDDMYFGICSLEHPGHVEKNSIQHDNTKPLLIFGTNNKLSPREPFLTLAYHFSQRVLSTQILVIIGYSFGDDYINRIVEQGFRKNQKLRIIVVSPSAAMKTKEHAYLDGTPRVTHIDKKAKDALNGNLVFKRVYKLLDEMSKEEAF
jgi:hypothetical protein